MLWYFFSRLHRKHYISSLAVTLSIISICIIKKDQMPLETNIISVFQSGFKESCWRKSFFNSQIFCYNLFNSFAINCTRNQSAPVFAPYPYLHLFLFGCSLVLSCTSHSSLNWPFYSKILNFFRAFLPIAIFNRGLTFHYIFYQSLYKA